MKNVMKLKGKRCRLILAVIAALTFSCSAREESGGFADIALVYAMTPKAVGLDFVELPKPLTGADLISVRLSPKARIRYSDGTYSPYYPLEYKTLFRTGDADADQNVVGALKDINGNHMRDAAGNLMVSVQPDSNDVFFRNGRYQLLTHFESYPGAVYLTEMSPGEDGTLRAEKFSFVDFSSLGGTVFNCAGTQSPWGTHIGGEEDYIFDSYYYDPNVLSLYGSDPVLLHVGRAPCTNLEPWTCEQWNNMRKYTGSDYTQINPYLYGYITETSLDAKANPTVTRHYTMGKYTPELAVMMPDQKTAFMSDDGSYDGLFMFVADAPGVLSSGSLYIAKFTQTSPLSSAAADTSDGGQFTIKWIKLGSGTNSEIKALIDKRPTMSDFFEINANTTNMTACQASGAGFKLIIAGAYNMDYRGRPICLRLRDGENGTTLSSKFADKAEMLKAAAFLETRKYGGYLGGTTEFEKGEGLTYNPDDNKLYFAIGRMRFGMQDVAASGSRGLPGMDDHIQIYRNDCGAVYELGLTGSQTELVRSSQTNVIELTDGSAINSNYVATSMAGLVIGKRLKPGEEYTDKNRCHPDAISMPDNISYFMGTLFIGEDSSSHFNNMGWAYDVKSKKLTRIMTLPTGSELTGGFFPVEVDGRLNLFANVQHPFGDEVFDGNYEQPINQSYITGPYDKRGYVGYIYGLPKVSGVNVFSDNQ